MSPLIAPSLLSANFADLQSDIEMINRSKADWLHLDIMDGVFVPYISFGFPVIEAQGREIIRRRRGPAVIPNDGRQTPWRGHPCFIAQHATGCCCRGCLRKWHGIPEGRALSDEEISAIAALLLGWIRAHAAGAGELPHTPDLF